MPKKFIRMPEKNKNEFINDSEYIKYCKKRYNQRIGYEWRQIHTINKSETYPLQAN